MRKLTVWRRRLAATIAVLLMTTGLAVSVAPAASAFSSGVYIYEHAYDVNVIDGMDMGANPNCVTTTYTRYLSMFPPLGAGLRISSFDLVTTQPQGRWCNWVGLRSGAINHPWYSQCINFSNGGGRGVGIHWFGNPWNDNTDILQIGYYGGCPPNTA